MQDLSLRWDDVQLFLALYRDGSLGRAGERLSLDPSTLSRRLAALEKSIALTLFDRSREGLQPTAAAERLLPVAEVMERSASDFAREAEGFEREVEGRVRLSTPPGVADQIVAPRVGELIARHPKLHLELDARVDYVDLSRREADLALRAVRPRGGDLVARKVYATRSVPMGGGAYVRALGTLRDASDARWITYGEDLAHLPVVRWVRKHAPRAMVPLATSSFSAQLRAAGAGVGLVLAPEPIAEASGLTLAKLSRGLTEALGELPEDELWLVGHRALREVPRVAAVWRWLEALFAQEG